LDSFSNAGEAEGEEFRLLQKREQEEEAKLEWLSATAREGFDANDRGDYVNLRSPKEIEEFVRQIGPGSLSRNPGRFVVVARRAGFEVRVYGFRPSGRSRDSGMEPQRIRARGRESL
jgi:hypothetical protein